MAWAAPAARPLAWAKEAAFAAAVAFVLALPLAGFRLPDGGAITLGVRPMWVVVAMIVVAVGRFLLAMNRDLDLMSGAGAPLAALWSEARGSIAPYRSWIVLGALAAMIVLPFLPFGMRRTLDLATLVLIYVMLGAGLNIVVGLAGLLDLGYVAFYAVGAYTYALLSTSFGLSFWVCLPIAGMLAAGAGLALGFPVLRLRGDYLAIVTLGFGEMVRITLINWNSLTGGSNGIARIPTPGLFGMHFTGASRLTFLYFIILALAALTMLFAARIRVTAIGRAWEALREDEIACRSLGLNPTTIKLSAFAIGAMFAGFAGAFFAARQGFVSPASFTFMESAIIVAIVVLGGMGSQTGLVLAAVVLVLLPEIFRDFAQLRLLLFGAAMVLIMVWRPQGLIAHRAPSVRLAAKSAAK
jgi:branched-chain amino acid transport system permease protein